MAIVPSTSSGTDRASNWSPDCRSGRRSTYFMSSQTSRMQVRVTSTDGTMESQNTAVSLATPSRAVSSGKARKAPSTMAYMAIMVRIVRTAQWKRRGAGPGQRWRERWRTRTCPWAGSWGRGLSLGGAGPSQQARNPTSSGLAMRIVIG